MKLLLFLLLVCGVMSFSDKTIRVGTHATFDKPFDDIYGPKNETFEYKDLYDNRYVNIEVNYSYDKIDALSWIVVANQTNYSYSMFCWHNRNHSITLWRLTCSKVCGESIEFSMFVNYCEIHIWYFDAYPGDMNGTMEFDLNVTVVYEGGPIPKPWDPVPEPSPEPPGTTSDHDNGLSPGVIAGITLGFIAFVALASTGGWFGYRWWINSRVART